MVTQDSFLADELARVFHDREQAELLVRRAGFSPGMMPDFTSPLPFWNTVVEMACNGVLLGGIRAILDEAAALCPGNPKLGRSHEVRAPAPLDRIMIEDLLRLPRGAPPVIPLGSSNDWGMSRALQGRPRSFFCFSLQIGASSSKALNAFFVGALAVAAVMGIVSLPVVTPLHQPAEPKRDRDTHDSSGERPLPGGSLPEEDVVIVLVEEDPVPEKHVPKKASPSRSARKRAPRTAGTEAPRGPSASSDTNTSWNYRTYNCLVGPDEPDGSIRTNKKGECTKSDRDAFLRPRKSHPPGRPAARDADRGD